MGFSFNSLPINTLVGADSRTFNRVTASVDITNRRKYHITKACERILSPIYSINNQEFRSTVMPKISSPVFIIGHWRSGTTLLHNLLSCDPQFGYCTTYQTVFPHLMLYGESLFKRIAKWCMPATRPTDNLELSVEQPQEEEFAIANMTPSSFYHFWIFPQNMALYRNKYLLFDSATESEVSEFCNATYKMMQIALHCQNRPRFLSKNPPHTARIALLLKMFPNAKFIYIVRNPYKVFHSTRNFFRTTLDSIALQSISDAELDYQILSTYKAMIERYEKQRNLIAPNRLFEIRFEDLQADMAGSIAKIYEHLDLGDFTTVQNSVTDYAASKSGFRQNRYKSDRATNNRIEHFCSSTIERWGYRLTD